MPSKIISAPTGEPVTLTEAREHLRIDDTNQDALIHGLITAARQTAETICRRAFVTQQWKAVFDRFPRAAASIGSLTWESPQWGIAPASLPVYQMPFEGRTGFEIFLPLPPLISVDSIVYIDPNGATVTMASTDYIVDDVSEPARITPAYGTSWAATRNQTNAVTVTFTCGYGSAEDVPHAIKQWMLLQIAAMYENREADVVIPRAVLLSMPFADGLLAPYRVITF